ncbi:MAG TPA: type III secretion system chaperone [Kofleriaceae bacterium]|nr:type III secretion system chaperone [Kofleriaceae bacterium]
MDDVVVDHRARIAEFFDRFGRERNLNLPPLGDDGVGMIQRGSAVVTIHVLADKNILLLLSRVAKQPTIDEARAKKLLVASFTETGDAAFALHPNTGDLYLRILRSLDGLDYEEFEDIVHSIAQTADLWDDKLADL